ncbi:MAG TPA: acyl carrier protein [Candidatus Paceibacterota bacterium]|nr:acyl carrier protein [Candidatus Paceibacterota bacterium]
MDQEQALRWIAEVFEQEPGRLSSSTPRSEVATWDSLGVLTLMAALHEHFGIVMTTDQLTGMKTVGDILEVLQSNGKLA